MIRESRIQLPKPPAFICVFRYSEQEWNLTLTMGTLFTKCLNCCTTCKSHCKDEPDFSGILNEPEIPVKQYSWDLRPKRDPKDYTISLLNSSQAVKLPGDVCGEQVVIRNCVSSRIYVFDHSSQVTIDDCSDCLIILGPVKGSVFLRDSKNCTLLCAASQIRLRDCENIYLFVAAESDPIIEASSKVIVSPYFLSYKGMKGHFGAANLSRFKCTRWAEIYDFTPNEVCPNWSRYDPKRHKVSRFACLPDPPEAFSELDLSFAEEKAFVPVTHPEKALDNWVKIGESRFTEEEAEAFYTEKVLEGKVVLCEVAVKGGREEITFTYIHILDKD